jgi:hypothetical protein
MITRMPRVRGYQYYGYLEVEVLELALLTFNCAPRVYLPVVEAQKRLEVDGLSRIVILDTWAVVLMPPTP